MTQTTTCWRNLSQMDTQLRQLPFAKHPSTPSARMRLPFFSAPMAGFLVLGRSIGLYPLAGFDYSEWEN